MKKPRRESEQALHIYAEMVVQAKPLTVAQLVELTGFLPNVVKPMLDARVECKVMTSKKMPGGKVYEFTPDGYEYVKQSLGSLHLEPAQWARSDRRFSSPGHLRPV